MIGMIKTLVRLAKQQGIQMDPIDADMVLKVAKAFSNNTALGADLREPAIKGIDT